MKTGVISGPPVWEQSGWSVLIDFDDGTAIGCVWPKPYRPIPGVYVVWDEANSMVCCGTQFGIDVKRCRTNAEGRIIGYD